MKIILLFSVNLFIEESTLHSSFGQSPRQGSYSPPLLNSCWLLGGTFGTTFPSKDKLEDCLFSSSAPSPDWLESNLTSRSYSKLYCSFLSGTGLRSGTDWESNDRNWWLVSSRCWYLLRCSEKKRKWMPVLSCLRDWSHISKLRISCFSQLWA